MGTTSETPPGGGYHDHDVGGSIGGGDGVSIGVGSGKDPQASKMSYSDRLKTNVRYDQRLKRNVLEITLEKTENDATIDDVDADAIARVFKTLGIDIAKQVKGSQVHYGGEQVLSLSGWWQVSVLTDSARM